jgi:hypothetical protein
MIGSNESITLGNNLVLDGKVLVGAADDGTTATCSGCFSEDIQYTGHINPDPLGANNGGQLSSLFASVQISNDNASNAFIQNNVFSTRPNDTVTFTAGDYYLTAISTHSNSTIIIDDSAGPVRFFVDGPVNFQPKNGISLNDPLSFQIYAVSSDDIDIKPNSDLSIMLYAPNAEITLYPGGHMKGAYWGKEIQFQPQNNGAFFLDTSLQDRWLANRLELHMQYEARLR